MQISNDDARNLISKKETKRIHGGRKRPQLRNDRDSDRGNNLSLDGA